MQSTCGKDLYFCLSFALTLIDLSHELSGDNRFDPIGSPIGWVESIFPPPRLSQVLLMEYFYGIDHLNSVCVCQQHIRNVGLHAARLEKHFKAVAAPQKCAENVFGNWKFAYVIFVRILQFPTHSSKCTCLPG